MRRRLLTATATIFLLVATLAGCGHTTAKPVELEASVGRLTPILQISLDDCDPSSPPSCEDLLEAVYEKRPDMRETFKDVKLDVWTDCETVVLLVASPDNECWFEDSSETIYVDRKCYQDDPPQPARFTLIPEPSPQSKPASPVIGE